MLYTDLIIVREELVMKSIENTPYVDLDSEDEVDRYIREAAVAKMQSDSIPISQMAKILGVHRSTVSRDLERTTQGRYEFKPRPPAGMSKKEFDSRLDEMLNQGAFRKTLRHIADNPLLMIDVAVERDSRKKYSNYGFMPRAGQLISRLIERANIVGVAWGSEIRPYSESIPGFAERNRREGQEPIQFLPLCGISESLEESLMRSSTVLATRYHKLVNHGYEECENNPKLYNLNSLPIMHTVFSDKPLEDDEREKIDSVLKYISEVHSDYVAIYSNNNSKTGKSLITKVDTIFTSVGGGGDSLQVHLDRWFSGETIGLWGNNIPKTVSKKDVCEEIAAGDIAGILLPKPGPNEDQNRLICTALNSHLATLRPEHLKACRDRTLEVHTRFQAQQKKSANSNNQTQHPPAGVVAVVRGVPDITPLLVALSEGYVSRVIMDITMEKELKKRIQTNIDELTLECLLNPTTF